MERLYQDINLSISQSNRKKNLLPIIIVCGLGQDFTTFLAGFLSSIYPPPSTHTHTHFTGTENIPAVLYKLTKLERLDLSNHTFKTLGDDVKALTSLEHLNLSGNPSLESVSPELAKLPLKGQFSKVSCPVVLS